jgi:integrase
MHPILHDLALGNALEVQPQAAKEARDEARVKGEPIYPDTVGWLMTKIIRAYNKDKEPLPHARVHDLRHIHATTLLLNGVPVHVVAARLGHADPAITLRVYAHVIRTAETAAAEVFARVMSEAA